MHGDLINSETHMKTLKNPITFAAVSVTCLALSGCAPIIIGGGALVGTLATKEKGISGTVSDSAISTKIKAGLYKHESDLFSKVGISVQSGDVLLTSTFTPPAQGWLSGHYKIQVKTTNDISQTVEFQIE